MYIAMHENYRVFFTKHLNDKQEIHEEVTMLCFVRTTSDMY